MIRTFVTSYKVSFVQSANLLIYFIKRIPFAGKKFPETLYAKSHIKIILGIISLVFGLLKGFFNKLFYLFLAIMLPAALINRGIGQLLPVFLHIFFFMSFILGSLMKTTVTNPGNKQAFDMITLMRADAREYYLSEILYSHIETVIHFILPLIIIGLIIGFSPLNVLILLLGLASFRLVGEWIHLYLYDKTGKYLIHNGYLLAAITGTGLILAYGIPALGFRINFDIILFNMFSIIIMFCLVAAALVYLWNYKNYTPIAKSLLNKDSLVNVDAFISEMTFGDVKLDEENLLRDEVKPKHFDKMEGYEYFNYLFFLRHRKILVKPVQIRLGAIAAISLIAILVMIFIPAAKLEVVQIIKRSSPLLVFLMYLMSTGERICKAMFHNCDVSMLRYSFYRERTVILSNFSLRLKKVILLNMIPALALILALVILVLISGFRAELPGMIPLFLSILSLACFFSIHHLFMYYVIQPYTSQLVVESPLFRFISGLIWLLAYGVMQTRTTSVYFTFGVLVVTVLYMIVAVITIYKVAPRTFRLK
jgi:hypothetical protein